MAGAGGMPDAAPASQVHPRHGTTPRARAGDHTTWLPGGVPPVPKLETLHAYVQRVRPNQPATSDRLNAAPAMPALMCDRGVEKRVAGAL